jgi:hypothetical protein
MGSPEYQTREAMCVCVCVCVCVHIHTYIYCNGEAPLRNHLCRGKAISITYSECVSVALVIKHTKRMRRIILLSVACPALPYFSTLSHKRHDFRRKHIEHKIRILILSTKLV